MRPPSLRRALFSYLELTKPRVTTMVVLTTAAGFYLGLQGRLDWLLLVHALAGTGAVAAGTAVLNQFMERENDGRMRRTARRPLPSNRLKPFQAMLFGVVLVAGGTFYLGLAVNGLTALLGFLTSLVYLLVYTPLKTRTSLCTTIGAIPGAVPPLMGWAAVRNGLDLQAWILFAILFLWQFPHFLAIAWVYREDYQRGGFRMLPLLDEDGTKTAFRVVLCSTALLLLSLVPSFTGLVGMVYLVGALLFGSAFLYAGLLLARRRSRRQARLLLRASVVYLPLLLILMVADKV